MPITTITFTLPEEQSEFNMAIKGADCHSALMDIAQKLRNLEKNPTDNIDWKTVEHIKDSFWEIVDDYNIEL